MRDPRLAPYRLPALAFAVYLAVLAASAAVLYALKLGPGAEEVRAFYLGSEERFTRPRSLAGLLEVAVPHLVAIPLVLFAAAHVVGFARLLPGRAWSALVAVSFGAALAGVGAAFAVRFVSPGLAWTKVAAFLATELALVTWAALLVLVFLPRRVEPSRASGRVSAPWPGGAGRTQEVSR